MRGPPAVGRIARRLRGGPPVVTDHQSRHASSSAWSADRMASQGVATADFSGIPEIPDG